MKSAGPNSCACRSCAGFSTSSARPNHVSRSCVVSVLSSMHGKRRRVKNLGREDFWTGVQAVREGRCPDPIGTEPAVIRCRCCQAIDVRSWLRRELGFGFFEVAGRYLQRQTVRGQQRETPRERIERTEIEVPAVLVGLAAVEGGHLHLPATIVDASRDEPERDVRRIEPVVRDRRNRIQHRRHAMRESDRAERWFPCESAINLPAQRTAQRPIVVRRKLHEEVVRMLTIVNRVAVAHLSRGEEIDRAAISAASTARGSPLRAGRDGPFLPSVSPSASPS